MYLELAQKYLLKARSTSGNTRLYFANLCQVCLVKEGATPEKIGTSQNELSALQSKQGTKQCSQTARLRQQQDHAILCKKFLDQCRQAHGASRQYYANLCLSTLAKYGISSEQIGATANELQTLQIKGFIESAANYLEEARNAKGAKRKCYADLCWEYLSKAKATPIQIGSSEDELQKMCV